MMLRESCDSAIHPGLFILVRQDQLNQTDAVWVVDPLPAKIAETLYPLEISVEGGEVSGR